MYTIKRMPEFDAWLDGIKDGLTRIRLGKRLDKAQRGLLILMLGGGDKSTQQTDIAAAIALSKTI